MAGLTVDLASRRYPRRSNEFQGCRKGICCISLEQSNLRRAVHAREKMFREYWQALDPMTRSDEFHALDRNPSARF